MKPQSKVFAFAAACAALTAMASPMAAMAQTQLLDTARDLLRGANSGRVAKSEPVHAVGTTDNWGDSDEQVARLRDERSRDDRDRDDRTRQVRQPSHGSAAGDQATGSTQPRTRSTKRPSPTPAVARNAAASRADEPARNSSVDSATAGCPNIESRWANASQVARTDQDRARRLYLGMLSACLTDDELAGTAFQAQRNLSQDRLASLMQEPLMSSPRMGAVTHQLKLLHLYALNEEGRDTEALELSRQIRTRLLTGKDAGALEISGWLELPGDPKTAERLFRAGLRLDRDANGSREGLVQALQAQGRLDAALTEAQSLETETANRLSAQIHFSRAQEQLRQGQGTLAVASLRQAQQLGLPFTPGAQVIEAWALHQSGNHSAAARTFAQLHDHTELSSQDKTSVQRGWIAALAAGGDEFTLRKLAEQPNSPLAQGATQALAQRQMREGRYLQATRNGATVDGLSGGAGATVGARLKTGDRGESQLTSTTAPLLHVHKLVGDGRVEVRGSVSREQLSDGVRDATAYEGRVTARTDAAGVDLTLGTGVSRVAGNNRLTVEARGRTQVGRGHLEAGLQRSPRTDSLRSYVGVGTGGQAMDTYAYVGGSTLAEHFGRYSLSWQLGGGFVDSRNAGSNGYYRAGAGLSRDVDHPSLHWLNVGGYASMAGYSRDENKFEGNGGGYFSPRSDLGAGLTFKGMSAEGGQSLYRFDTKLGYVSRSGAGSEGAGLAAESQLDASWLLNPHLILGASLGVRASPGYTDFSARMHFRVPLEPRAMLSTFDLLNQ